MNLKLLQAYPARDPALTKNNAGGTAYRMKAINHLAQIATTSFVADTYYVKAEDQLKAALDLCKELPQLDTLKVAIWAKTKGLIKDLPVILLTRAVLAPEIDLNLIRSAFNKIIKNGKDISNFVAIVRSGVLGRKSLGSFPKRLVNDWLEAQSLDGLFAMSVGNTPSLADVIKLSHPRPSTKVRATFYGWLLQKTVATADLPTVVQEYLQWKINDPTGELPHAPYLKLSSDPLSEEQWKQLALRATFNQLRSAMATFHKRNVFADTQVMKTLAAKLADPQEVARSRALPYNLMSAYMANRGSVPPAMLAALEEAIDASVENIPKVDGNVRIFLDVSSSMNYPVTGVRGAGTSSMTCVGAGAFIASCFHRRNPRSKVYRFDTSITEVTQSLKAGRVAANAIALAANGGGTNCSLPFERMIQEKEKVDVMFIISDNESWYATVGNRYWSGPAGATSAQQNYNELRKQNPNMKVILLDLTPNGTVQVKDDPNVLNLGGFSDSIYEVISSFVNGTPEAWVEAIMAIEV